MSTSMRITQGTFSFLPDLTDEQIEAQLAYALERGWALSVEYTDDPHPRNVYWELWGLPQFDVAPAEAEAVMREIRACRACHPGHFVKVVAYDARHTRQTTALSFIVQRPEREPEYALERRHGADRMIGYALRPVARP
jgi:ribulose-bisphosphate carboxylase small chain